MSKTFFVFSNYVPTDHDFDEHELQHYGNCNNLTQSHVAVQHLLEQTPGSSVADYVTCSDHSRLTSPKQDASILIHDSAESIVVAAGTEFVKYHNCNPAVKSTRYKETENGSPTEDASHDSTILAESQSSSNRVATKLNKKTVKKTRKEELKSALEKLDPLTVIRYRGGTTTKERAMPNLHPRSNYLSQDSPQHSKSNNQTEKQSLEESFEYLSKQYPIYYKYLHAILPRKNGTANHNIKFTTKKAKELSVIPKHRDRFSRRKAPIQNELKRANQNSYVNNHDLEDWLIND